MHTAQPILMETIQLYSIHTICPICGKVAHHTELMTEEEVRHDLNNSRYRKVCHSCMSFPDEYNRAVYHFNTNTYTNKFQ